MGIWGADFYDNDVVLDIQAMTLDYVSNKTPGMLHQILSYIKSLDKYDDQPIAWIALADTLHEYNLLDNSIKHTALNSAMALIERDEAFKPIIDSPIKRIQDNSRMGKKNNRSNAIVDWQNGDIILYDAKKEFLDHPAFSGWNLGCWRIEEVDFAAKKKYPLVYFFRTKFSVEELHSNCSLVLKSQFWPTVNRGNGYVSYRTMLALGSTNGFSKDRIHFCGNYLSFPILKNEVIIHDHDYTPVFYWEEIEERLLSAYRLFQ